MTEPTQPRAVYHDPKQKRPCYKCDHCEGDEWPRCGRRTKPKGLPTTHTVNLFGTCGYWKNCDD